MEEVYVVTWELYEDFSLVGVFSTLEKAIARCRQEDAKQSHNFYRIMGDFVEKYPGEWHCPVHKSENHIGYFIRKEKVE